MNDPVTAGQLTTALLAAQPLLSVLPQPVRVHCADPGTADLLADLVRRLDLPPLTAVADAGGLGPFERVLSGFLGLADRPAAGQDVGTAVAAARAADFTGWTKRVDVPAAGGAVLPTYTAGDPTRPAVVVVSACGMPARLVEGWLRPLAQEHFVVVSETRELFTDGPAGPADVPTQVDDLFAVMDHLGLAEAHLLGLCGGAVLAVVAADRAPDRVSSLSLWHGDFDLGDDSPKTDHQRNLQALMAMAADSEKQAASVHAVLAHTMLGVAPPLLAHLVVYPYARPDLLHRYCVLNGHIMAADLRPHLGIGHRTLVVTSEDDATAHPDGSRVVADRLAGATLTVLPHGDHLSLFRAEPHVVDLALRFLADPRTPGVPPEEHHPLQEGSTS
ncbi:alpha/beta hydrolase [Actinosynnema sp. NPDC047251]|uniref:alpha/beta fold hydrolase n=1 Tax=Saccharothrix espanaensis TaxID=103731 RepID=UPI0002EF14F9|nr:alpha/beta hydrolase [Saccharothrix espanaensis]